MLNGLKKTPEVLKPPGCKKTLLIVVNLFFIPQPSIAKTETLFQKLIFFTEQ
jgi:hypothetical protein